MRLEHQFTVPAGVDVVWQALLDPERVAPCMPGATLAAVDGKEFSGSVKVKLGPVTLLYKGSGEYVETDEAQHKVVIKASGKDARGNGTAAATVTVTLSGQGESTEGDVVTELNVTGRPAQFGRGMISEVSGKLLDSFATCLSEKLGGREPGEQEADTAEAAVGAKTPGPAGEVVGDTGQVAGDIGSGAGSGTGAEADTEAVDLLQYAGSPLVKRLAPVAAAGAVLGAAVIVYLLRRRRGRESPGC